MALQNISSPTVTIQDTGWLRQCKDVDIERISTLSFEDALTELERLRSQAVETIERKGKKKSTKFLSWFIDLANSTKRILDEFAGLQEIIKAADARAGPFVCGALMVLLTLAENHQLEQRAAAEMFQHFASWLRRISNLREAFSNDSSNPDHEALGKKLRAILYTMVRISGLCVKQSSRSGWKRFAYSQKGTLRAELLQFTAETADFMTDIAVDHYVTAKAKLTNVQGQLKLLEEAAQAQKLQEVERVFGQQPLMSQEQMMSSCLELYHETFSTRKRPGKHRKAWATLTEISVEFISARPSYGKWTGSHTSSFLLLAGLNFGQPRLGLVDVYSWLSPVATQMAGKLRADGKCMTIFCSLNALDNMQEKKNNDALCQRALKNMIYQLLQDWRICHMSSDKVVRDWDHLADGEGNNAMEKLFEILADVLKSPKRDCQLFIILDGLEQLEYNFLQHFLGGVLEIIYDDTLKVPVKVLVTCNQRCWTILPEHGEERLRRDIQPLHQRKASQTKQAMVNLDLNINQKERSHDT